MLYECALNTSNYMFSTIKPGMLMDDVDKTARRYCCEQLKKIGLLSSYDEIGKYMWHGGAHHVGYDVHDVVDALGKPIAPNMVFCVDIGIYAEDLGIGFRVEDNCLVTPTGAENLCVRAAHHRRHRGRHGKITGEISMKLILPEQITATQYAAYLKDWGAGYRTHRVRKSEKSAV